jgi:hypothetical protein
MQLFIIIMQNIQTNCGLMNCRLLVKKDYHYAEYTDELQLDELQVAG